MSGPTFLGIGAQKAGTTWLHHALEVRPDVWVPPVKELHFFDEKIGKPQGWFANVHSGSTSATRWRRQVATERRRREAVEIIDAAEHERRTWCSRYFFEEPSIEWYRSLFANHRSSAGEITPEYAVLPDDAIAAALTELPDIRVIYLLRNPIEREWSAAQMGIRKGLREPSSVLQGRHRHAHYPGIIDRWSKHLGDGRLHIGWYDDIVHRPHKLLIGVLDFIGCSTDDIVVPEGRPNRGNIDSIPAEYAIALAELFSPEIDELSARFGGAASNWAAIAQWLTDDRPSGDLAYPLWMPR